VAGGVFDRGAGVGRLEICLAAGGPAFERLTEEILEPQKTRYTSRGISVNSTHQSEHRMRKMIFPLAAALTAMLFTGCTGPEQKLGRGLSNSYELVRWGEMRSTIEKQAVFERPGEGYYGFIHGFDRSLERAGLGIYEVVTFPLPSYDPIATKSFAPDPVFPESYKPGRTSDPLFYTDTYTGFSGGDVAPFMPGSRFTIFEN
jgi:putative exosortase-associated protein (TIGR04073 family)